VLETTVAAHQDRLERETIHRETQAFWEVYDTRVRCEASEYVALNHGDVVDEEILKFGGAFPIQLTQIG
jgi:hypothetical protein